MNEAKAETSFCYYVRVLVIATWHIIPFDRLIRQSSGTGMVFGNERDLRTLDTMAYVVLATAISLSRTYYIALQQL